MKADAGFTLIEILIAMFILSFGLLSLASMQIVAIRVNTASSSLTSGSTLVQDKIEALMALQFDNADLADPTPVGTFQCYPEPAPPKGYSLTWCVDNDATPPTVKTINIEAAWHDGKQPRAFRSSFVRTAS